MGSSSKAKSSRKKGSKLHSKPRKIKKVKKSRRSKSKKVTRRHDTSSDDSIGSESIPSASNDSHSLYSDSDSINSVSFSSSSSEGSYRARKKVSQLRSKLKNTRKTIRRRRSSSSKPSEDFSRKKKRKRFRKNVDSKSRKKSQKNKSRRDVCSSPATSDSYGCSTCKEESASASASEDSESQKDKFKSREYKKHKRESCEERVGTKNSTHRSPSCSSYSRSRDQSYSVSRGDENFVAEVKSRRLRSVITFAEQAHEKEGNISEKDSLKEEIIYDRDDYPSPKSNDSSHGGSKRDVTSHSPVTSGVKRQKEYLEGEETLVSNCRKNEATKSKKNADDGTVHVTLLNETNKHEEQNRTYGSDPGANLGGDDLEAILRQKALENLWKFRGGILRSVKPTTNRKNKDDGDANQSFSSKADIVQKVLPKQDNTDVIYHVKNLDRSNRTTSGGEVSCPDKDIADRGNAGVKSGIAKQKEIRPPDGLALSRNPSKKDHITTHVVAESVAKSESQNSFFGENASGVSSNLSQEMVLPSSPDKKLTENGEIEGKIPPRTTHSITPSITNNSEANVNNTLNEQSTSGGQGSNEEQTDAKDGSQFEQKTMSVMRGGEMVQVSYKVYIPKRAPALARRQLKR